MTNQLQVNKATQRNEDNARVNICGAESIYIPRYTGVHSTLVETQRFDVILMS